MPDTSPDKVIRLFTISGSHRSVEYPDQLAPCANAAQRDSLPSSGSAFKHGRVRHDSTEGVELPARDHEKIVPLTRKPVWKFIDSVNEAGSVGGGIVFIDAHTGLRQKKILALRFTSIDWLNGEVAASKAVAKFWVEDGTHMWVWKIGPPKAQKSNRGVALPQSAIEPLSELRQTTKDPAGLLFPGPDSLLLDPDYFNAEIFAPIAQHAGMEGFRFQDLRHFFASMLILQGESPKLACAPMGHFSIQITFGTYGHRFLQAREEAAKKLQNAMFAGRREPFGNSLVVRQAKAASMEGSRARPNDRPRLLLRNGMIDKGRLVASVDWNH